MSKTAKTILILAANPMNTSRLRLDLEVREIDNGLQRARRRDEFVLRAVWAARPVDVRRAMLDLKPNIVHFCGHGSGDAGIAFEDETGNARLASSEALAGFFSLFGDTVECVVLNACYSEAQGAAIAKHIRHVVGMRKAIGDRAAIEFAVAFYDALGAGRTVEFAYRLACNAILWTGAPQHLVPKLHVMAASSRKTRKGTDAFSPGMPSREGGAPPLEILGTEALHGWIRVLGRWTATHSALHYIGPDDPNTTHPYGILLNNTLMREGTIHATIRFPEQPCTGHILFGYSSPSGPYFTVGIGGHGFAYVLEDVRPTVGWQAFRYCGTEADIAIGADYQIEAQVEETHFVLRVNGINMLDATPPREVIQGQIGLFAWGKRPVEFRDFWANPS